MILTEKDFNAYAKLINTYCNDIDIIVKCLQIHYDNNDIADIFQKASDISTNPYFKERFRQISLNFEKNIEKFLE